jgi:hypothetical protein
MAAGRRSPARDDAPTVDGVFRKVTTGLVAAALLLAGATPAVAETYTNEFRGEGSSSFGFAWDYARWDAYDQALADGFTDPYDQCEETWTFGSIYWAIVIWECTREV